ncbi:MAG: hypothetical protein GY866_17330 [Proteobacteria bacterium]|nr:hypothetical protein [Pseudomonadota bacterium]
MAVDAEEFVLEEVEALIQVGNKLKGSDYHMEVEGCPNLSLLTVTCSPAVPSRNPIEDIPGKRGVTINEPGEMKSGGQFPVTFHDGFKGPAFDEYMDWVRECVDFTKRKKVRIYGSHELGDSSADFTYLYCWPDMEDAEFDNENKTAPAKFTFNLHFAGRRFTK